MIVWGVSAGSHDAALAVFDASRPTPELLFASHSERFSGLKNDPDLDAGLVEYAKRNWGAPGLVVWYEQPFWKAARQWLAGQGFRYQSPREYMRARGIDAPVRSLDHHRSHAAAGYLTSGFEDATVIVVDAIGEFETATAWHARGTAMRKFYSAHYPDSLGLFYSAMTDRAGLKANEEEYILMGMAAYGDPDRFSEDMERTFFEKAGPDPVAQTFNFHNGCALYESDRVVSERDLFDLAAGAQRVYERRLSMLSDLAKRKAPLPPSRNLVLAGGCALNCVANALLLYRWDRVWVFPNPGDAGSAVGCVLAHFGRPIPWPHAMWGYDIPGPYPVEAALAELLRSGMCGVASGRAEFGPRALGNRSLLADPRGAETKARVNAIKKRQEFRPFSPAILEEHAREYFEMPPNLPSSPYMSFTVRCKKPETFPAIVHVDGTSRVQTVRESDGGFRRLLERWYEVTGCPMLLNTSLNIKGRPICNTERDAREFAEHYGVAVFS